MKIHMEMSNNATMDEDGSGLRDRPIGHRRVLGDVTNFCGKRKSSSTLEGSDLEGENGFGKGGDKSVRRRECKGVEDLVKEKENVSCSLIGTESLELGDGKDLSLLKSVDLGNNCHESEQENVAFGVSQATVESKELLNPPNCDLHLLEGDGSRHSCISSMYQSGQCEKLRDSSPVTEEEFQDDNGRTSEGGTWNNVGIGAVSEEPMMYARKLSDMGKPVAENAQFFNSSASDLQFVGSQESKTDGGDCLIQSSSNKMNTITCLGGSASSGATAFGFDGYPKAYLNGSSNNGFNSSDCFESCKTNCSCSLCLKASYLLSDLHYQDVRDRLAALKKSRKQVRQLVASYNHNEYAKIASAGSDKSMGMQLDLMHQWRSLFRHTEDILAQESNRLQSNLVNLKDLRDNCQKDLEMINGAPSDQS